MHIGYFLKLDSKFYYTKSDQVPKRLNCDVAIEEATVTQLKSPIRRPNSIRSLVTKTLCRLLRSPAGCQEMTYFYLKGESKSLFG